MMEQEGHPLITVLIPVYNSPDLFQTLASVAEQNYRPLELILVDDASKEFDEQKIKTWIESKTVDRPIHLHILQNEKNLGTVKTMNRGLAVANGRYVFNLADDDAFYDNEVLSDWVNAFERTGDPVITAKRARCDSQLNSVQSIEPDKETIRKLLTLTPPELFEAIARENVISGACTAWRMDALRELGCYDERYRLVEDYPAYLKLLRSGKKIGFLNRVVIRYRTGGESTEGKSFSRDYEEDIIRIHENEILPYCVSPATIRRKIRRWKKSVRFDRWYNGKKEQFKDSPLILSALKITNDLYHPVRTGRMIRQKIRGKSE
ncbi:MAG: glycosyltransferase [Oscillospiraceae bacterium]|nr:glycosyltransferase [Oscillospiraceae bacterium]